jgi:hypothetical protein
MASESQDNSSAPVQCLSTSRRLQPERRHGFCCRAAVAVIAISLIFATCMSSVGAVASKLTPTRRCVLLVELGRAGQDAHDRWQSATSASEKYRILVTYYRQYLPLVRRLSESPPPRIAKDLRVLERQYRAASKGGDLPDGSAGARVVVFTQKTCSSTM